jgi:hypothetical protein
MEHAGLRFCSGKWPWQGSGPPRYTPVMARGWESKSVEEQQTQAAFADHERSRLSPHQVAKHQCRKGLQLSRQTVLQRLEAASNSRYRKMLEQALADLDAKISQLE